MDSRINQNLSAWLTRNDLGRLSWFADRDPSDTDDTVAAIVNLSFGVSLRAVATLTREPTERADVRFVLRLTNHDGARGVRTIRCRNVLDVRSALRSFRASDDAFSKDLTEARAALGIASNTQPAEFSSDAGVPFAGAVDGAAHGAASFAKGFESPIWRTFISVPKPAASPQRMTAAEANAEIQRFVNETRSPRTGDGHQFGINPHGRAVAPLGGLMAGFDLTWRGEDAGTQVGFCVVEASTGNQVTAHHPTPESAFDAALGVVQAVRDHRSSPHATLPKSIADHEAAVKALNPRTMAEHEAASAAMIAAEAAIEAEPGCTYDLMRAVEAARVRIGMAAPKAPSATSGGHLDAPGPVDHTARAERELVSFATVRRLPVSGAPGEPSIVWLRAELDGCGLTFWIGTQGPMFYVKHPTRGNITVGHHTAEEAVKGAIYLAKIAPMKPATSGGHLDDAPRDRPTSAERAEANEALTTFARMHSFRWHGQPEVGGSRVIVRPTNHRSNLEISWEFDGALTYFARDRNDGSLPAVGCKGPAVAYAKADEYLFAKAKQAAPTTTRHGTYHGRPRVYVCHPYSDDPTGNTVKVAAICKRLVAEGITPIAPQVYLAAFVDDATERDTAMVLCLDLMRWCDEVRVYGPTLSPGMLEELRFAMARGMTITHHRAD